MYAPDFGLTQDPFSIAPDPRFLYMSERHREALAHLLFGVTGSPGGGGTPPAGGGGFVLLTGDIGAGKTTVCRCFLEQTPAGCHVAYIFNPRLTVADLLRTVCDEFHLDLPPTDLREASTKTFTDALNTFLLHAHADGKACVLVIDEAQNLSTEVLEQLRLLTNLETNERKLLQIVLIGQPELRDMLARPELEQLSQRVVARYHLGPLSADDTRQYIGHRMAVAGHKGPLPFDARALARIHQLTRGVPRRINLLCGRALLGAWTQAHTHVDRATVEQAAAEVFGTATHARAGGFLARFRGAAVGLGLAAAALAVAAVAVLVQPDSGPVKLAPASATAALPPTRGTPAPAPHRFLPVDDAWLQSLPADGTRAWRELLLRWDPQAIGAPPCPATPAGALRCWNSNKLTLPELRELGRPGILTLRRGDAGTAFVLLTGMDATSALLQHGTQTRRISLDALAHLWTGAFGTFWRPPPGDVDALLKGQAGPALDWLGQQLAHLDGATPPTSPLPGLTPTLRARLQAFQRVHGLRPDGLPGPLTLMQLRRATIDDAPRLADPSPASSAKAGAS